jgi:hypothetical protein
VPSNASSSSSPAFARSYPLRLLAIWQRKNRAAVFSDENELSHGVKGVLSGISPDELEVVFANWVVQLDSCIQRGGKHMKKQESNKQRSKLSFASHVLVLNFMEHPESVDQYAFARFLAHGFGSRLI